MAAQSTSEGSFEKQEDVYGDNGADIPEYGLFDSFDDIAVAVKDGVVTLSGYVISYYDKDEAEKAAKRVYGVKAVANDIEVKSTSTRTNPKLPETRCATAR